MIGLGETQKQLLGALYGVADGATVDALAGALAITPTAVRQHLTALERDGLVVRGATRATGGRPQQLFVLSDKGRENFPRQYSWFSELLLTTLRRELGTPKLEKTLRILGDEAGAAVAAPAGAPLAARARVLVARMGELGYDASLATDDATDDAAADAAAGTVEVVARNCVFHKLAQQNPEVCSFDLGLIERVAGAKAEHRSCIVRGDPTCCFRLRDGPGAGRGDDVEAAASDDN